MQSLEYFDAKLKILPASLMQRENTGSIFGSGIELWWSWLGEDEQILPDVQKSS